MAKSCLHCMIHDAIRAHALEERPAAEDGTALVNLGRIRYVGPRGTAGMIRQGVDAPAYWAEAHVIGGQFLRPKSWMHCAGGIGPGRYDDVAVLYIDEVYGICSARHPGGGLDVFVNDKDGRLIQMRVARERGAWTSTTVATNAPMRSTDIGTFETSATTRYSVFEIP